ncbi:MAG: response regulator transcription factor [Candidatus Levyibacteriota bacterium]
MKVLIVEDEHRIANSIRLGLQQERYTVDVAYDGTTGFDLAVSEEYDIIILDRMLPGMEGVEIARKLREKSIHTPILILTAKSQLADKVEGLESGADDYLTKPFAFEELLARIRALIRRPAHISEEKLKVGDLTLDTKSYEVKRAGKQITLSQKEFALLEYLMRHPKQILNKDQIISHVWSYESDVLPNTVEVYIGYLRNKIDKPFKGGALIQTIRGFGYRLG